VKCPHCLVTVNPAWTLTVNDNDPDGLFQLAQMRCPACGRLILKLAQPGQDGSVHEQYIHPRRASRTPVSDDVPSEFATDYSEACMVFADSAKASAALSRRCLQNVLRDHFAVKPDSLSKEIDEVLPKLPSHLADGVDAIRNIGNFAAHPLKDSNTSAIIDVEPGEAEWCLDVLESMFDFAFVQPELMKKKKLELNQKLADAGKPPMK
jgi:hypothetical protein